MRMAVRRRRWALLLAITGITAWWTFTTPHSLMTTTRSTETMATPTSRMSATRWELQNRLFLFLAGAMRFWTLTTTDGKTLSLQTAMYTPASITPVGELRGHSVFCSSETSMGRSLSSCLRLKAVPWQTSTWGEAWRLEIYSITANLMSSSTFWTATLPCC